MAKSYAVIKKSAHKDKQKNQSQTNLSQVKVGADNGLADYILVGTRRPST